MGPLLLSTARSRERLRTVRGNGPCGSRQSARDREESGVPDHAVVGANAPLGDVPSPAEHLEGLDMEEALRRKGEDELLHLAGGRQVRTEDAPRLEHVVERGEGSPRLREIQHASVVALTRSPDIRDVADPELEDVGELPEYALDVLGGLRQVLVPELVGHDATVAAHGAAERDRERSGPRPGLQDPRAGEHVGVGEDLPEVLGVDHLRAAFHLERVVGEARAERDQHHPASRLDAGALGAPEHEIVRERPRVGVVGRAALEDEEVGAPALVDQQRALPRLEGGAHAGKASAASLARMSSYGSCVGRGRVPRVTSTEREPPLAETRSTPTVCPGCSPARIDAMSSAVATFEPSIATITSPSLMPAAAAGPPSVVAIT